MLTKSNFTRYLQCSKALWLYKFRKDLMEEVSESQQHIFDQGFEVEEYAQKLFPSAASVDLPFYQFREGREATQKYIRDGAKTIFQATAMTKDLYARTDILSFDEQTQKWDLYEVKSTTTTKPEHIPDVCFQKIAFQKDGFQIGKTYLIHLNNEYIKKGPINPKQLLQIEDISDQVNDYQPTAEQEIPKAQAVLKTQNEITIAIGKQCTTPYECPFIPYCWKNVPDYSIYDIVRIKDQKIKQLQAMKIENIEDVPDDFPLNETQKQQVQLTKSHKKIIDTRSIKEDLQTLQYPLYFLDYETIAPAIPLFDGTKPYQQVCFQYSLHTQKTKEAPLEHHEYLHLTPTNPIPKLLDHLSTHIGPTGTIIVWNKSFEMTRNTEMAEVSPSHRSFLENINTRIYDLMTIFTQHHYIDPECKGRSSIKKVLPALVPELSYSNLDQIQEGGTASLFWLKHIYGNTPEKEEVAKNLLEYCKMDTVAMVEILRVLEG